MFDDSFYIIFTWAPEYFTWAQAWVCPGICGCITYGWISNESMKCESALLLTKVHQYAASNTVRWFSHQWNVYLCRHKGVTKARWPWPYYPALWTEYLHDANIIELITMHMMYTCTCDTHCWPHVRLRVIAYVHCVAIVTFYSVIMNLFMN